MTQSKSTKNFAFPIVGVGASAGGLQAFRQFISGINPDTPAGYVLIQHLDPTHESMLTELLARNNPLEVCEVSESVRVESGKMYVIKPDSELAIAKGELKVSQPEKKRGIRTPIDVFFRSLAEDQKEMAVGVVLSGTGSDGSIGLKAIKAMGGMTIVQRPDEAEFDGMPRNAIAGGGIDFVVQANAVGATIDRFFDNEIKSRISAPEGDEQEQILLRIFSHVRSLTGVDFRGYKRATICRRIERRAGIHRLKSLEEYLELIRKDPIELQELAHDLLISVTSFFRDPDLWKLIAGKVIPMIFANKGNNGPKNTIRAWVPGCATGEEAYTLAMLLVEAAEKQQEEFTIQVYGTDIDARSLEIARKSVYPRSIINDVGKERMKRFFKDQGDDHLKVKDSLREMVVFARQDITSDPPFSRIDLVTCRNLLIYLNDTLQNQIIPLIHFALQEEGYLILGNAETIGRHKDLFSVVSKKWRIYRRESVSKPMQSFNFELPATPSSPAFFRQVHHKESNLIGDYKSLTQRMLMQHFSVGAVLVDGRNRILYQRGKLDPYISQPEGHPTNNLLELARTGLKAALRETIRSCLQERELVSRECLLRGENHLRSTVRLSCRPAKDDSSKPSYVFIVFEKIAEIQIPPDEREPDSADRTLAQLEEELRNTREELRSSVEDLETSNEELKASNEEVMSMNEELQSTNEELETSREELQSLNEELTTMNNQLEEKLRELAKVNDDLSNLLRSVDMPILFLDVDGTVQRFTRATTKLFNLINSDIGRPVSDLANKFSDSGFQEDVDTVLDKLEIIEREVCVSDDSWYIRRVLPYRTEDNRIQGTVVTFNEISRLKSYQEQLKESEAFWKRLFNDAPFYIALMEGPEHVYMFQNEYHRNYTGKRDLIGKPLVKAFPELKGTEIVERFDKVYKSGKPIQTNEFRALLISDGEEKEGYYTQVLQPWFGPDGKVAGVMSIAFDATESVRMRHELQSSELRFRTAGEAIPFGVWWCDPEGRVEYVSDSFLELTGKSMQEIKDYGWIDLLPEDQQQQTYKAWQECVRIRGNWEREHTFRSKNGDFRTVLARGRPVIDEDGELQAWVGINLDISDRKKMENSLREQKELLSVAIQCSPIFIFRQDSELRYTWLYNEPDYINADEILGKTDEDILGKAGREIQKLKYEVIRDGKGEHRENTFTFDGKTFTWLSYLEPVSDCEGKIAGLMGASLDISERKQWEDELRAAKLEAEAGERAKSFFLNSMSHDIRTPLTTILGYSEVLIELLKGQHVEIVEGIHSACEHLMGTLESVLNLSRLEGNKVKLDCKNVSLREQVKITWALYKDQAKNKKMEFKCDLPDDDPLNAFIDPVAFNRVLNNLIGNAVRFTEKGDRIILRLYRSENGLPLVSVEDSGKGIDKDFHQKIFEPFMQSRETEKLSLGGSGLGLAICRRLVKLMNGRIWVESEPGRGAKFFVELQPVDDFQQALKSSKEPAAVIQEDELENLTIMVCDDHNETHEVVRLMIPKVNIIHAYQPEDLLTDASNVDVILLDIDFYGKSMGVDLMKQLRKELNQQQVRLVAFTAHGLPGQMENFLDEGFDGYLAKPFTRKQLISTLLQHGADQDNSE